MNKQDVDNIFEYISVGNIDGFMAYVNDREAVERIQQLIMIGDNNDEMAELFSRCCTDIAKQMRENSVYDYFEEKGLTTKNKEGFFEIITNTKISKEESEKYLNNDNVRFDISERLKIIKSTKDKEYMIDCLDKIPEYSKYAKQILLKEIGSKELVDKFIKENPNISPYDITRLVVSTGDKEYISGYLDNPECNFAIDQRADLLEGLQDSERIKNFLDQNKYILTPNETARLIKATGDVEYIKSAIETGDFKLLENNKIELIKSIGDAEYTKQKIQDKSLELDEEQVVDLIKSTNDVEYMKSCISNKELGLTQDQMAGIICATGQKEYMKACINDEAIALDPEIKARIIRTIRDKNYVKDCIDNEKIGLNDHAKIDLILATGDEEYMKSKAAEIIDTEPKKKIKLPEGMTIGVEIEADKYWHRGDLIDGWQAKGDGSVPNGSEFISPILTGSEQDSKNIYTICNILQAVHGEATERCGGHVHIGANYLKSKQAYMNLIELWGNSEEILYAISNKEGEVTRLNGAGHYAVPLSKKIEDALESGTINLENEGDLATFVSGIRDAQKDRYSGLNFMNMADGGKKTIEFRLSNGTIDPDTWIENINLFGGIIAASERIAQIQEKTDEQRTDEERKLLAEFDKMKTPGIDEKEKLGALLKLTIPEEDREIYESRYETNKELLEEHIAVSDAIKGNLSTDPLDFKGKKSKTLKSAIDATEIRTTYGEIAACEHSLDVPQMERNENLDLF